MTVIDAPHQRPPSKSEKSESFVQRITELCRRDPGRRAQLRRGLRLPPERAVTMHAVVAPWLDDKDLGTPRERAYYAVAAMIAEQTRPISKTATSEDQDPGTDPTVGATPASSDTRRKAARNVGAYLADAVRREGRDGRGIGKDSAERRLHLLVRQDLDGVHRQLPGLVRHMWTVGVTPDWPQLLKDLAAWPYERDRITKAWLQSFYRALPDDQNPDDNHTINTEDQV